MCVWFNNQAKLQQLCHAEAAARDPFKRTWPQSQAWRRISKCYTGGDRGAKMAGIDWDHLGTHGAQASSWGAAEEGRVLSLTVALLFRYRRFSVNQQALVPLRVGSFAGYWLLPRHFCVQLPFYLLFVIISSLLNIGYNQSIFVCSHHFIYCDDDDDVMIRFWSFIFPETYICYRGYFNLNCYIVKKVQKKFPYVFKNLVKLGVRKK